MSEQHGPTGPENWAPVQGCIRALAERLEKGDPDGLVDMDRVLKVAEVVSQDAEPMALAGIMALILSPYCGEKYHEYADRLREAVSG
ncbi:hypothetical protein GTY54_49415 [Streptomyces sp. SID625]|nr:hypothetical protein [Streptomyces sp. SID625]MYR63896.1 hypothetical protein [Streptomyces sp. SID625]